MVHSKTSCWYLCSVLPSCCHSGWRQQWGHKTCRHGAEHCPCGALHGTTCQVPPLGTPPACSACYGACQSEKRQCYVYLKKDNAMFIVKTRGALTFNKRSTLFLLLSSKAMAFAPFKHPSHSILPSLGLKLTSTNNTTSNFKLCSLTWPPPPPQLLITFFLCAMHTQVCVCAFACLHGLWCERNTIVWLYSSYFWVINAHHFVDHVKCNALTHVSEIWHYRNDRYYYYTTMHMQLLF